MLIMIRRAILFVFLSSAALVKADDSQVVVDKALSAVGGRDKILKIFRMEEIYHSGSSPEPAEGRKRSQRISVIEQPGLWWLGKRERGDEPAKDDVRAWSLDILLDPKSKFEMIPDISDEGVACVGIQVSESVTPEMKLYFDKETHLLKRAEWRSNYYRFTDWKEYDGLKYAARTVIFKLRSDKAWFHHEITKLERLDSRPEGLVKP